MALLVGDNSNGSSYGVGGWDMFWSSYVTTTAGTATKIYVRASSLTGSKINAAIYDSTGSLLSHCTAVDGSGSVAWHELTLDSSVEILASTTYKIAFWSQDSDWEVYYESGITGAYGKYVANVPITDIEEMPDTLPAGSTFGDDYHFQIYADGTEGGGASSTPSSTLARGIAVGMFKGMGIGSGQYP